MKTVKEVKEAVRLIAKMMDDDESAHSAEDELHRDVLQAIADGTAEDPKGMARAALETSKMYFSRWCA